MSHVNLEGGTDGMLKEVLNFIDPKKAFIVRQVTIFINIYQETKKMLLYWMYTWL